MAFLRWALPRLGLRWPGFRRVRGQVCKRIRRRIAELELSGVAAYRERLGADPAEWAELDFRCRVTVSRFYRDRALYEDLAARVLPALARSASEAGRQEVRAWSVGCASGEEPYSLVLAWRLGGGHGGSGLALRVLGTDIDPVLLDRARRACYPPGSLRELPGGWLRRAFREEGEALCLRPEFRAGVELRRQDVRRDLPEGLFDLVLCRNLVLTYYRPGLQREVLARVGKNLREGGALVIGSQETLPAETEELAPWSGARGVFRKPY